MSKLKLTLPGLYISPLTCFDDEGKIDKFKVEKQLSYVMDVCRPSLLGICAVEAQEYQFLSDDEREQYIRWLSKLVSKRCPTVVGVSHPSYRRSLQLVRVAQEINASAIQILIPRRPSGGKVRSAEVLDYVEAIATSSPLPVVVYHHPGPGADVSVDGLLALAKLPNVVAIKESSRDMRHIGLLLNQVPSGIQVWVGMEAMLTGLQLGAAGSAMPPPGSGLARLLLDAFNEGNFARASELQRIVNTMPAQWFEYGLTTVMKESMSIIGIDCGSPYPPFGTMPDDSRRALEKFWRSLGKEILDRVSGRSSEEAVIA
jgi:4-hydroxy-tetrahydrodipicolinate synthase